MAGERVVSKRCTCVGGGKCSENMIFQHQRVGEGATVNLYCFHCCFSFPLIFALFTRKFKCDVGNDRVPSFVGLEI